MAVMGINTTEVCSALSLLYNKVKSHQRLSNAYADPLPATITSMRMHESLPLIELKEDVCDRQSLYRIVHSWTWYGK
jgi:hypothetical protein